MFIYLYYSSYNLNAVRELKTSVLNRKNTYVTFHGVNCINIMFHSTIVLHLRAVIFVSASYAISIKWFSILVSFYFASVSCIANQCLVNACQVQYLRPRQVCLRNWRKPSSQRHIPLTQRLLATLIEHCSSTEQSYPNSMAKTENIIRYL